MSMGEIGEEMGGGGWKLIIYETINECLHFFLMFF